MKLQKMLLKDKTKIQIIFDQNGVVLYVSLHSLIERVGVKLFRNKFVLFIGSESYHELQRRASYGLTCDYPELETKGSTFTIYGVFPKYWDALETRVSTMTKN